MAYTDQTTAKWPRGAVQYRGDGGQSTSTEYRIQ